MCHVTTSKTYLEQPAFVTEDVLRSNYVRRLMLEQAIFAGHVLEIIAVVPIAPSFLAKQSVMFDNKVVWIGISRALPSELPLGSPCSVDAARSIEGVPLHAALLRADATPLSENEIAGDAK